MRLNLSPYVLKKTVNYKNENIFILKIIIILK